jgi:hypothetical protein
MHKMAVAALILGVLAMNEEPTTVIIQRCLDALPGDAAAEPLIRELLEQATSRLRLLCGTLLHKSYPRLTRPPVSLETDELLGGRGRAAHGLAQDPPPDRTPVLRAGQPAHALAAQ